MNTTPSADACPGCGTIVAAIWTHTSGASAEEADTQGNTCPTCSARLRRSIGDGWTVTPA
jgi:hypothetical protein